MNKRENLLRALRREGPEYVPFDMDLCPAQLENLKKRIGTDDFREYYDFAYRYVELNPTRLERDFSGYYRGGRNGQAGTPELESGVGRHGHLRQYRSLPAHAPSHEGFYGNQPD